MQQVVLQDKVYTALFTPASTHSFLLTILTSRMPQSLSLLSLPSHRLPPFSNVTSITAAGVVCDVTWVSEDGRLLQFLLPPTDMLCSGEDSISNDCGYMTITLRNEENQGYKSATLSCPPFCPPIGPASLMPVPGAYYNASNNGNNNNTFVPSHYVGRTLTPAVLPQDTNIGIYITQACTSAGFADPDACRVDTTGVLNCAFGAGDGCRKCPSHAICPGGYRAWPRPGYYSPSESSDQVVECAPPALHRCVGWDLTTAATKCGVGYAPRSHACSACDDLFYQDATGSCASCPSQIGAALYISVITSAAIFLGALIAACACVYGLALALTKLRKLKSTGLPRRVLHLGAWTITTVQVVSQVGLAAGPQLPPVLLAVYAQLSFFQFHGVTMPSACVPGFPFLNEVVSMCVSMFLLVLATLLALGLSYNGTAGTTETGDHSRRDVIPGGTVPPAPLGRVRSACRRAGPLSFRLVVVLLTILFPTVTNSVLSMVNCMPVTMSKRSYAGLAGADATPTDTLSLVGKDMVTVHVLQSNPSYVCYKGQHISAAALAWVTLFLYCIGFPLLTTILVHARLRSTTKKMNTSLITKQQDRRSSSCCNAATVSKQADDMLDPLLSSLVASPLLSPFLRADYRPSKHWFILVDRAVFLILGGIAVSYRANFISTTGFFICTFFTLFIVSVLFAYHQPFPRIYRWKFVIKIYSMLLSVLASLLNFLSAVSDTSSTAVNASISPLAYLAVAGSAGLFVALATAFFYDILVPKEVNSTLIHTHTKTEGNPLKRNSTMNLDERVQRASMRRMSPGSLLLPADTMFLNPALIRAAAELKSPIPDNNNTSARRHIRMSTRASFVPLIAATTINPLLLSSDVTNAIPRESGVSTGAPGANDGSLSVYRKDWRPSGHRTSKAQSMLTGTHVATSRVAYKAVNVALSTSARHQVAKRKVQDT
jgi:hypothetical protein